MIAYGCRFFKSYFKDYHGKRTLVNLQLFRRTPLLIYNASHIIKTWPQITDPGFWQIVAVFQGCRGD